MTSSMPSPQVMADEFIEQAPVLFAHDTASSYTSLVRQLRDWNVEAKPWAEMSRGDLNEFLTRPRKRTAAVSQNTLYREASTIRTFYAFLLDEYKVRVDWPMEAKRWRLPRGETHETGTPVPDEVWLAMWKSPLLGCEDRIFLGLGYFCGMRRKEMCQLSPHEVKPRTDKMGSGTLEFLRKGGQRRAGIAYASIIDTLLDRHEGMPELAEGGYDWMDLLEITAKTKHGQPFLLDSMSGRIEADRQRIWNRLRAIQREVGIPTEEWVSPHSLRHSAATNLALCGVPVSIIKQQLSHSNTDMTERYVSAARQLARHNQRQRRGQRFEVVA